MNTEYLSFKEKKISQFNAEFYVIANFLSTTIDKAFEMGEKKAERQAEEIPPQFVNEIEQRAIADHDAKWHPIDEKFRMGNLHLCQPALAAYRAQLAKEVEVLRAKFQCGKCEGAKLEGHTFACRFGDEVLSLLRPEKETKSDTEPKA